MSVPVDPTGKADGPDLTTEALSRAALYRLLAHALAYPTEARAERARTSIRTRLEARVPLPAELRDALAEIAGSLERADLAALGGEYLRLFGPAGRAPLHETAYGDAGRMLGRAAQLADISGFYIAFGLQPTTSEPLPEDHLLLELELMSILSLKEAYARNEVLADALAVTVDAQRKFLGDHLGTWLDGWLAQLEAAGAGSFHVALATAVRDAVRHDCARLDVVPLKITSRVVDAEMGGDELVCPRSPSAQA